MFRDDDILGGRVDDAMSASLQSSLELMLD
jgi:hypothetical protein